jgi:hypothetical protein
MTNVPEPNEHQSHDLVLIAAHAAGDTDAAERDRATALIDACDECARLHADLLAISAAVAELPAAARPRDFRLTEEQAAGLRPTGWRGILAQLAGPRFSFAAPLGTAMATLGLIVLVLAGPGLPTTGSTPAMQTIAGPASGESAPEVMSGTGAPLPAAGAAVPSPAVEDGAPAKGPVLTPAPAATAGPLDQAGGAYAPASPGQATASPRMPALGPGTGHDAGNVVPVTGGEREAAQGSGGEIGVQAWIAVGAALLLLAGLLLAGLRLIARRIA